MDESDQKLVEGYLNGDDPSFEILLKKYLKPVYNFLFSLVRDAHQAEDLAQITFVKAWKNIRRYDRKKSFKTWLFTIARNSALDYFKKKKTIPFSDFSDATGYNPLENMPDEQILPDELLEKIDSRGEFEKILEKIPAPYQLILNLRYKEDFSLAEIAGILKTPYNTVKSRHQRALAALKKVIIQRRKTD